MTILLRTQPRVFVQTAAAWPDNDAGWESREYLRPGGDIVEVAGAAVGTCALTQVYGSVRREDLGVFQVEAEGSAGQAIEDLAGHYVRLLVSDSSGAISYRGETWTAFWWGVIDSLGRVPDGAPADAVEAGGEARWLCRDLRAVLDRKVIAEGYELSSSGLSQVDPGYMPPFNRLAGGDRSSSTRTVGDQTVYVHDRRLTGAAQMWTAAQVVQLLLAGPARPRLYPDLAVSTALRWVLSDPDGCLSWEPSGLDVQGQTVLEALAAIISERRGLTWWLTVSGSTVTVHVGATSATALTVGGYTAPAATVTATLDSTALGIGAYDIEEDSGSVADVIVVEGSRPWTGITLAWSSAESGALKKGWSSSAETAWDSAADDETPAMQQVWRRWELRPQWNGKNDLNTDWLEYDPVRTEEADASYGTGGLTGFRGYQDSQPHPPGSSLELVGDLPCAEGFTEAVDGARQPPVVVAYDGSSYYDLTAGDEVAAGIGLQVAVSIEQEPAAIRAGVSFEESEEIASLIGSGGALYITIGIREPVPMRVSWQRPRAEWPADHPRVLRTIEVPSAELWRVADDAVTGCSSDGTALTRTASELSIRDETDRLREILALARRYYAQPSRSVRWRQDGLLDTAATYRPGTVLTQVTEGDRVLELDAVVTRRTWRQATAGETVYWSTSYETSRVLPAVGARL